MCQRYYSYSFELCVNIYLSDAGSTSGTLHVLVVGLQLQKFSLGHNSNSCSWVARLQLQRYNETTTAETGI